VWLPRILVGFAGAPPVLGIIKTLAETGAGTPFTLGDAAYYVGWAAVGAYCGFFVSWLAGLANWLLVEGFGVEEDDIENLMIGLGLVLWSGTIVLFVFAAPPPESEPAGFFRVVGVVTVVGAGIAYAAYKSRRSTT